MKYFPLAREQDKSSDVAKNQASLALHFLTLPLMATYLTKSIQGINTKGIPVGNSNCTCLSSDLFEFENHLVLLSSQLKPKCTVLNILLHEQ